MQRSLSEVDFMGWPAIALEQGSLTLHLVPVIGGRLMGITFDGEQLCFTHPALRGKLPSDDAGSWAALCGDWAFPLWGGGKTWLAPESAWPEGAPHRDLDSGAWSIVDTWFDDAGMGAELRSPVCRVSGLQLTRRLSLPASGSTWTIDHTVHNRGTVDRFCGLWDVLMLNRPAQVHLPLHGEVHQLPGKAAPAHVLHIGGGRVNVDCREAGKFKLGFDSSDGAVHAELDTPGGRLRYQRRSPLPGQAAYAHGHPLEVYNAPRLPYFEIETHSPACMLPPGASLSFRIDEAVSRLPPPGAHT